MGIVSKNVLGIQGPGRVTSPNKNSHNWLTGSSASQSCSPHFLAFNKSEEESYQVV